MLLRRNIHLHNLPLSLIIPSSFIQNIFEQNNWLQLLPVEIYKSFILLLVGKIIWGQTNFKK